MIVFKLYKVTFEETVNTFISCDENTAFDLFQPLSLVLTALFLGTKHFSIEML